MITIQVAKEKALQLERKKKAAQFLAQLAEKKTGVSSVAAVEEEEAEAEGENSSAEEGELVGSGGAAADNNVSDGWQPGKRPRPNSLTVIELFTILPGYQASYTA